MHQHWGVSVGETEYFKYIESVHNHSVCVCANIDRNYLYSQENHYHHQRNRTGTHNQPPASGDY